MKGFIVGFLSCLSLGALVAMTPLRINYAKESDVFLEFQNIYKYAQDRQFTVLTTTPAPVALLEGEIKLVSSNDVLSAVTKIQGSTYTVTFNK